VVVSKGEFTEQSNGLREIQISLVRYPAYMNSTYTPATTDNHESGFLTNAFVFRIFDVAKECGNDREVLWSSCSGTEG
jgi:hypothetical protein